MNNGSMARRSIRVRLADLPGALHELTSLVAAEGVNIVRLEIVSREQPEVWDDIELVAGTEEQLDRVVAALRARGLTVIGLPGGWVIRDWATDVLHALEAIGNCVEESDAMGVFARSASSLANVEHAFVLMEPSRPDAVAAETRWALIESTASVFDPERVSWCGDDVGTRIVISAMRAARQEDIQPRWWTTEGVGAVVEIPMATRRPAHLVVVGRRPIFLAPELARLEMFVHVAAPHLRVARFEATA